MVAVLPKNCYCSGRVFWPILAIGRRRSRPNSCFSPAVMKTAPTIYGLSGTWCRKMPLRAVCVALATTISEGRRVKSRAVSGIDQDIRLNKALWLLGERMAELKAGR